MFFQSKIFYFNEMHLEKCEIERKHQIFSIKAQIPPFWKRSLKNWVFDSFYGFWKSQKTVKNGKIRGFLGFWDFYKNPKIVKNAKIVKKGQNHGFWGFWRFLKKAREKCDFEGLSTLRLCVFLHSYCIESKKGYLFLYKNLRKTFPRKILVA